MKLVLENGAELLNAVHDGFQCSQTESEVVDMLEGWMQKLLDDDSEKEYYWLAKVLGSLDIQISEKPHCSNCRYFWAPLSTCELLSADAVERFFEEYDTPLLDVQLQVKVHCPDTARCKKHRPAPSSAGE